MVMPYSYDRRQTATATDLMPIIQKLDKRQRIALRSALKDDGSGSAPRPHVKKLIQLGLAFDSGHKYEHSEWGEAVRSQPIFYLTPLGKEVAKELVAQIGK